MCGSIRGMEGKSIESQEKRQVEVRQAIGTDIEEIRETLYPALRATYEHDPLFAAFEGEIGNAQEESNKRLFVARENGKIVGFCRVSKGEKNTIDALYILPDSGENTIKSLWTETRRFFGSGGKVSVEIFASNESMRAQYASLGFHEHGKRSRSSPDGKHFDVVEMIQTLE